MNKKTQNDINTSTGQMKRKRRRKKKKSKALRYSIITAIFILFFALGTLGSFAVSMLNKLDTVEFDDTDLGIDKETPTSTTGKIKNVVLFGIDQSEGDVGRSDAIIIATVDSEHKKLKLTSLSRDSYVNIEGYGYDKLTHAYAYGKEGLAIKTINQNFGLDITDYAKVNFTELGQIIDEIGGITLNIEEDEVTYMNNYIRDLSADQGISPIYIDGPGSQTVSGLQATAYSRIRYTDGGDDKRTERHRTVLISMFNTILDSGTLKLASIVNQVLPYVQTSLSAGEVVKLGTNVLSSGMRNIEQLKFPLTSLSQGEQIDGVYYTTFDEDTTKQQIQDYIYRDIKPVE